MANIKAQFLQFLCHAWAAIATQRQGELLTNMRKHHHVLTLALAERTFAESAIPSGADIHDLAQPFDR